MVHVLTADSYAELTKLHPEVDHYKLYLAQALHKVCMYDEALQQTQEVTAPKYHGSVIKLQVNG